MPRFGNWSSSIRKLRAERPISDATATIQAPVEHLDLATVIKVSEAVSGEIVLERLIDTLMRTAIEHAGAERGLLILPRGDDYRIEAEAHNQQRSGESRPATGKRHRRRSTQVGFSLCPSDQRRRSLARRIRSESIRRRRVHSRAPPTVCALPPAAQANPTYLGCLYLENSLTPHAFTPARMAVLKLLASAAAISMENTRLYSDLEEREAKIRRLVDANILGIVIWNARRAPS